MINAKQAKLNAALNALTVIDANSNPIIDHIFAISTPSMCQLITDTLLRQAGEIQSLTNRNDKLQKQCDLNSQYESGWDSLIFAIMGADAKAGIIDGVDIDRITTAAIEAVSKLASERDEKQRVAEAFQRCAGANLKIRANVHELKIAPEYMREVVCGQKKAETRINDREFQVNDHLILKEWENDAYTGWQHEVVITHVCDFPYVLTGDRWVSLSISPVHNIDPDAINRYLNSHRMSKTEGAK